MLPISSRVICTECYHAAKAERRCPVCQGSGFYTFKKTIHVLTLAELATAHAKAKAMYFSHPEVFQAKSPAGAQTGAGGAVTP